MKIQISEIKRMQQLAGILKESENNSYDIEDFEIKGSDGTLKIKLYKSNVNKLNKSILEFCKDTKQEFCVKANGLADDFKAMKNLTPTRKGSTTLDELEKLTCEEIQNKLYKIYLSGMTYDYHGGNKAGTFRCGDISQKFSRMGY